jgi:pimeloyl-ACP methyl ester carboxylesterase
MNIKKSMNIKKRLSLGAFAGCVAVSAACGGTGEAMRGGAASDALEITRHDFTTSDGLRLHYARLGDSGTPVILIHGSGGMAQTWLDNGVAHALAEDHVVIAADMRGHGRSQGPRTGDMALDVIELMDHLGFERTHIHGFSMGGSITARLMARVPERIITAAFGGSGVREEGAWAERVPPDAEGEDPYNAEAVRMYQERRAAARAEFGEGFEAEQAELRRLEEEGWTAPERPGPPERPLDLTTIDFPVLAIVGEYDGFYERTHRLWRELKSFQSIKLASRGHLSSYYPGVIPDEYLEGIVTFINSHDER